ncbi:flagellin [Mesorhizobium sp. Root552]|uniref:flagellin N-terminal helical domain-containing protein n=1 Tax=Mesorhizobium sp. Root552 TaxID=1736555 RepID=UPI0006FBADA1|nr:flagellin [Mesorhizobium sp. Root552]KQZ12196.1 flagellin [Mesorhizobium sp. Root552]
MASIMTNASALTALQSLNATNKNLEVTQSRISTGYRVNDASDNAAYWSIATTMRSDNQAMTTVQDALGLGASKVDTAYTGINKAIDTVNQIKVKLVAAYGATDADKAKIQTEIASLQAQMKSYAEAATFSGTNMLSVTSTKDAAGAAAAADTGVQQDVKVVSAFNRNSAGAASISTIDIKVEGTKLFDSGTAANLKNAGLLDRATAIYSTAKAQDAFEATFATQIAGGATDTAAKTAAATAATAADGTATVIATKSVFNLDITAAADGTIGAMLSKVDSVLKQMTTAATNLGAAKSRIDLQKTFTQSLMDSIDRGVGQLVDADMNKESTRLQLSIANSGSQSILSLFR